MKERAWIRALVLRGLGAVRLDLRLLCWCDKWLLGFTKTQLWLLDSFLMLCPWLPLPLGQCQDSRAGNVGIAPSQSCTRKAVLTVANWRSVGVASSCLLLQGDLLLLVCYGFLKLGNFLSAWQPLLSLCCVTWTNLSEIHLLELSLQLSEVGQGLRLDWHACQACQESSLWSVFSETKFRSQSDK